MTLPPRSLDVLSLSVLLLGAVGLGYAMGLKHLIARKFFKRWRLRRNTSHGEWNG